MLNYCSGSLKVTGYEDTHQCVLYRQGHARTHADTSKQNSGQCDAVARYGGKYR